MSWPADLRRLGSLSCPEVALLAEAIAWTGIMRTAVGRVPLGRITGWMGLAQGATPTTLAPSLLVQAESVGWAVQVAAARAPWQATCLVQALAGVAMLRRRGIPGALNLGVATDGLATPSVSAHAWLCCGDAVLTGGSALRRYRVITRFVG